MRYVYVRKPDEMSRYSLSRSQDIGRAFVVLATDAKDDAHAVGHTGTFILDGVPIVGFTVQGKEELRFGVVPNPKNWKAKP